MENNREESNEYIKREKRLQELEYALIKDFINLRKSNKLTQQNLADQANVLRETVARIENVMTSPQVRTLIKLLEPLGYTLKIEKIDKKDL